MGSFAVRFRSLRDARIGLTARHMRRYISTTRKCEFNSRLAKSESSELVDQIIGHSIVGLVVAVETEKAAVISV